MLEGATPNVIRFIQTLVCKLLSGSGIGANLSPEISDTFLFTIDAYDTLVGADPKNVQASTNRRLQPTTKLK